MDVLAATDHAVYLVVEVVEDLSGWDVLGLDSLPGVACQPVGSLLGGEGAHLDAVLGRGQAELLIARGHWGEEAANDLVLCVELGIVGGHLEHAQVEEGDGAVGVGEVVSRVPRINMEEVNGPEGTTSDEDEGSPVLVYLAASQPVGGEVICLRIELSVGDNIRMVQIIRSRAGRGVLLRLSSRHGSKQIRQLRGLSQRPAERGGRSGTAGWCCCELGCSQVMAILFVVMRLMRRGAVW